VAEEVASLFADLSVDDRGSRQLRNFQGILGNTNASVGSLVSSLGGMAAAAGAAFGAGAVINDAITFEATMKNIQAVAGGTNQELAALSAELLAIGSESVAGPQAVASAFYEVASGVSDASVRMDTLKAAIALSEAGAADLSATTSGLISVMNSYGFSAEQAGFASDVLTRTVGLGVGSMDEFVAAIGPIAGLSASVGVSFDELGAAMAYMTTQGTSASQSATQIQAAMTALLNPNAEMAKGLQAIGYESGSAAIAQLGLVGTLSALKDSVGGSTDNMAKMLGSVEALRGTVALTTPEFAEFTDTFQSGLEGATEAARNVQLESVSAQAALVSAEFQQLSITIGSALLPHLLSLITGAGDFIDKLNTLNPAILPITAGVLGLGTAVSVLSPAVGGLVTVLGLARGAMIGLGVAFNAGLGPVGWLAAAILLLAANFDKVTAAAQGAIDKVEELLGIAGPTMDKLPETNPNMPDYVPPAGGMELPPQFNFEFGEGYSKGGWTGPGTGVAGVVHGSEFVVPQDGALVLRDSGGGSSSAGTTIYVTVNGTIDWDSTLDSLEDAASRRNATIIQSR
jgi:TP901 family phage tail tape measure protein